jgi:hypothetical protein
MGSPPGPKSRRRPAVARFGPLITISASASAISALSPKATTS